MLCDSTAPLPRTHRAGGKEVQSSYLGALSPEFETVRAQKRE